ncbi:MAG: sulfurtransferase TusA family protein [Sulfuricaulis sp.]|uniref:sulfurtransferase TusA family protein n=1 Tax=Sulfuricaulis sp. TaxID=2003553 RepID=UPI0025EA9F44|nr:sulfurtransferase TusA family protein [Sulfuricaulis sp.]MCR4348106.1 sulfurtransferase TusA family protein [Sulfuricaulis sp.]
MTANTKTHAMPAMKPQITLDLNGLASPGPLPSLRRTMRTLEEGQVLLLISDYPSMENDLYVWAKQTNNQLLFIDRTRPKGFGFYILKGDLWPVERSVDVTGHPCPTPVLEANKVMTQIKTDQNIKLISDCQASPSEVSTWANSTGHKLLGMTEDSRGVYRYYIKK